MTEYFRAPRITVSGFTHWALPSTCFIENSQSLDVNAHGNRRAAVISCIVLVFLPELRNFHSNRFETRANIQQRKHEKKNAVTSECLVIDSAVDLRCVRDAVDQVAPCAKLGALNLVEVDKCDDQHDDQRWDGEEKHQALARQIPLAERDVWKENHTRDET